MGDQYNIDEPNFGSQPPAAPAVPAPQQQKQGLFRSILAGAMLGMAHNALAADPFRSDQKSGYDQLLAQQKAEQDVAARRQQLAIEQQNANTYAESAKSTMQLQAANTAHLIAQTKQIDAALVNAPLEFQMKQAQAVTGMVSQMAQAGLAPVAQMKDDPETLLKFSEQAKAEGKNILTDYLPLHIPGKPGEEGTVVMFDTTAAKQVTTPKEGYSVPLANGQSYKIPGGVPWTVGAQLAVGAMHDATEKAVANIHGQYQLKAAGMLQGGGAGGGLTADNFAQQSPLHSQAQQLVDGLLDPSQLSKRHQTYNQVLSLAQQYSQMKYGQPFNAAQAQLDYKFAGNVGTQNTLKYLNSLTGADNKSGNLGKLIQTSDKINRTDFPALNDAAAWARLSTGDPMISRYHTDVIEVADQVAKILQGGGTGNATSDTKLKQAQELFRAGFSKDQMRGVADELRGLLANRKTELIGSNRYLQRQFSSPAQSEADCPAARFGGVCR